MVRLTPLLLILVLAACGRGADPGPVVAAVTASAPPAEDYDALAAAHVEPQLEAPSAPAKPDASFEDLFGQPGDISSIGKLGPTGTPAACIDGGAGAGIGIGSVSPPGHGNAPPCVADAGPARATP